MTDSETLSWIANHLVMFRPAMSHAYMEYIDDNGEEQSVKITMKEEQPSNLTLLLLCIEEAQINN